MCYHFINDMEEFSYQIQGIFGGIKMNNYRNDALLAGHLVENLL